MTSKTDYSDDFDNSRVEGESTFVDVHKRKWCLLTQFAADPEHAKWKLLQTNALGVGARLNAERGQAFLYLDVYIHVRWAREEE